jgi:hypothetical protein
MKASNGDYLRSIPYQPPQGAAGASEPPARRWPKLLLVGLGALVVVGAVAGIVYSTTRPAAPPAPANPKPDARTLEMVGSMSAAHLYQSYLNINLVADAVENDLYALDEGSTMLTTVANLMDGVDKQLEKLSKMDLTPEDLQDVQRIRALSSLLRVQIAALYLYWQSGDSKHLKAYHQTREKAWQALSDVLGLDK